MNQLHNTFILTGECIQEIIQEVGADRIMDDLIEKTYNSFLNFDEKNTLFQARTGFNYEVPNEGLVEWMPIRNVSDEHVYLKVVGYHPENPQKYKMPTVVSTISKYSTTTGHLEAILDGVLPTSLRTGAASAIASKLFGFKNSKVLGLIGCGAQAITQLHALSRVFNFDSVVYFDSDFRVTNSFKDRARMLGLDLVWKPSTIDYIVESSDILCTATSIAIGDGPLFQYSRSKEWLHVNAVGSDFPGKVELPKSLLNQSYVCPDFLEQAIVEGECQQLSSDQIGLDLINCIKKASDLKHLQDSKTVFDSTGMALEDQIVADLFISLAKKMNVGEYIHLESISDETQNPYAFLDVKSAVEDDLLE